jgi:hypothetical protein
MRTFKIASVLIAAAVLTTFAFGFSSSPSAGAASRAGFGFNAHLSGFPTGAVTLTGGGAYDPNATGPGAFVHAGGGFSCTASVNQGPLAGCAAGEGVRWDTAQILQSVGFKCSASDTAHAVTTDGDTVVLLADFYRAGDGNDESFSALMFVSAQDERPDLPGDQRVWIAGVGCGDGEVHFSK